MGNEQRLLFFGWRGQRADVKRWCWMLLLAGAFLLLPHEEELLAQTGVSEHHHYKVIDLAPTGGATSFFYGFTRPINNSGKVSGIADTANLDPNYPNLNPYFTFFDDPYIQRAYFWRNGVRRELQFLPDATSTGTQWINDQGQTVGATTDGAIDPLTGYPVITAAFWNEAGKLRKLGTLGGYESLAFALDDFGQVVGGALNSIPDTFTGQFSVPGATQVHAFIWQNGFMQDLGTLGEGTDSVAFSINDFGQVSGMSAIDNPTAGFPTIHPFFWSRQTGMVDIGPFGGSFGIANALNNRGQVAGEALFPGDEVDHAFIWSRGQGIRDLGTLGGSFSAATNVNDQGHVVGVSAVSPGGFTHTFLWRRGKMTDLGVVPGDECNQPFGINSHTQVVGFSNEVCEGPHSHAFLWEQGTMFDLNALVSSNPTRLHLFEAVQINEHGEIAGNGITENGELHAFVALPCDREHLMLEGCDYGGVDADAAIPITPPFSLGVLPARMSPSVSTKKSGNLFQFPRDFLLPAPTKHP